MSAPGVVDEVAMEVCNSPPPHPRGLGQPRPRDSFEGCPRARILVISSLGISNISAGNPTEILGMDFRLGFYSTFQVENPYLRFPSSLWAQILGMDFRLGFYSHNPRRKSIPKISVIFRSCGITTFHVWERPSSPSPICHSPESTAPLYSSPVSRYIWVGIPYGYTSILDIGYWISIYIGMLQTNQPPLVEQLVSVFCKMTPFLQT